LSFVDTTTLDIETTYCYKIEVVYNDCEAGIMSNEAYYYPNSINETSVSQFQIFPNPASNEVNIKGNVAPKALHLYNIFGQILYENAQCTANMKISVATLPAGIYFIKIDTEQGNVTQKIVINR